MIAELSLGNSYNIQLPEDVMLWAAACPVQVKKETLHLAQVETDHVKGVEFKHFWKHELPSLTFWAVTGVSVWGGGAG